MKKVIVVMIGIAFAYCCFMLFDICKKVDAANMANYEPSIEEVVEAYVEDNYPDFDYEEFVIDDSVLGLDYVNIYAIRDGHVAVFADFKVDYYAEVYF